MALAREFPGCFRDFFHPLFDILFGPEVSKVPAEFVAARVPEEWIREERESGRSDVAEFLEAFARRQGEVAPERRKASNSVSAIEEVHRLMLRLPHPIFVNLFCRVGDGEHLSRSFLAIEREVGLMLEYDDLDGLAGLLMLLREAAAMGDLHRCSVAASRIRTFLPRLATLPECRRIHGQLSLFVSQFCSAERPPLYTLGMRFQAGLPRSWQDPIPRPEASIPGHGRGDQPDHLEYFAETGVSLAALRERGRKVVVRLPAARRYSLTDERIAELGAGGSQRPMSTAVALFKHVVAAISEIEAPIKHVSMPTYEAFGCGEKWALLLLRRAHLLVILLPLSAGRDIDTVPNEFVWASAQRWYLSKLAELPEMFEVLTAHLRGDHEFPPEDELLDVSADLTTAS